ncbi:bacillithiol biosynthesis cysteine-adding enzyme BshC [Brevibacillus dissolubilis]|uniref:bacillithiol biosynthesis cysteine-adding enzyme BshC n=1 Tax=Brevibacillus dissolubilis TaxID=1844116 RepID=UPI0011161518|nr:bacillithiol biosynthesis cysteine-adding enzyme BshC [Brevibacillus dissolubilis]
MNIYTLPLPYGNPLISDYVSGKQTALSFLPCNPYATESYQKRLESLKQRKYPHRNQLADGLAQYNREMGNHPAALDQIERLRHEDTYVVVAGQQAGLLTGPLYTIYKAIDTIRHAKRLEEQLGVSVVPIFWIAGEDHDLDEINHTWVTGAEAEDTEAYKLKLSTEVKGRISASMLPLSQEEMQRVVDEFFAGQTETDHSKELRELLTGTAGESQTLVDWFARLMASLLGEHGLVLLESSSPFVRKLEAPVFRQILSYNEEIMQKLMDAEQALKTNGYGAQLQLDEAQANLFFYENGERLLLVREGDTFRVKHGVQRYTRAELLALLETEPERFSSNVVSRPLAQEHLLPTLAFVGGPGEIAYWAYYKAYFEMLGYELPIIVPRTSYTLVEGAMERVMEQVGVSIETVLTDFAGWKEKWLSELEGGAYFAGRFAQIKEELLAIYRKLVGEVTEYDPSLRELAEKNVDRLLDQVQFLEKRTEQSVHLKHDVAIKRVERLEVNLRPSGGLQERTYTVMQYLNSHGLDLVERLLLAEVPFDGTHKVLYIQRG